MLKHACIGYFLCNMQKSDQAFQKYLTYILSFSVIQIYTDLLQRYKALEEKVAKSWDLFPNPTMPSSWSTTLRSPGTITNPLSWIGFIVFSASWEVLNIQ